MVVELVLCLEGKAALIAAIFVHVALRAGLLLPLGMDLLEVHLESRGCLEILVAAFLPEV